MKKLSAKQFLNEELRHRLRHMREDLGLSRPKMAELLDLPATTLKNYELGYRETSALVLLAVLNHDDASIRAWGEYLTKVDAPVPKVGGN